jgi:hypothetical protein
MSLEIENINPLDYDQWDKLILESNPYSFFHSYAWRGLKNWLDYRFYEFCKFSEKAR